MIKLLSTLMLSFCLLAAHQASALDLGVQAGARVNRSVVPNTSSKDKVGFQGGLLVVSPIVPLVGFRTGALLVQRDAQVEAGNTTANRLFLDVPLTIQANIGLARLYGGADFGLRLTSSCTNNGGSCTLTDEKSMVFQPVVGLDFSILPTLSLGAFYEFETEYSRNWKQTAFGVVGTFML